jgi:hypothetical protein
MDTAIDGEDATVLAGQFYNSLGLGLSAAKAFRQALTAGPTAARDAAERFRRRFRIGRANTAHPASQDPLQQKTPRRGGGAFLRLLQGGESCDCPHCRAESRLQSQIVSG